MKIKNLKIRELRYFLPIIAFAAVIFLFHGVAFADGNDDAGLIQLKQRRVPLFIGRENKGLMQIDFGQDKRFAKLKSIEIRYDGTSHPEMLDSVNIYQVATKGGVNLSRKLFACATSGKTGFSFAEKGKKNLRGSRLQFDFVVKPDARLEHSVVIKSITLTFAGNKKQEYTTDPSFRYRPGLVLRAVGQDNSQSYRIPGIVTTEKGSLIAIYDVRYNNSKDLQEDIDIGMSRSTDNGQTWEPMKIIMDMGEWGGRPNRLNGIGDPSILYDPYNNTLWTAAVWISGLSPDKALWFESKPGMQPDETGQFLLVKSTDNGLTWSEPINITPQIKDPAWQFLLAGPGRGLTLKDGTLVFPAQFKKDIGKKAIDGGQYTPFSTIIYSKDKGQTWKIGEGAKPNTTEAQAVQLPNGSIMLNMRDDLNRADKSETNGRAVAVTSDMGKTWQVHPSSNSALPESNCMASLIDYNPEGKMARLFFSNPASKYDRTHMTVKVSYDKGNTWPEKHHILLNEDYGFGYSCLTVTADGCLGILYEGNSELFFQKIPLSETDPE